MTRLVIAILLLTVGLYACGTDKQSGQSAPVVVNNPTAPVTITPTDHDLGEGQLKAMKDERLTWICLTLGGFCLGYILPQPKRWYVYAAAGLLGAVAFAVPFLR